MRTPLAPLPDRFILKKEQWTMADRSWFERDAITGEPHLIETLADVAYVANTIDGDPISPTYGWQKSGLYRHGINPLNARIMEPVYTLAWAYTLHKPRNPYYHDAILRDRLLAGLEYWLNLQGKEGGFPEYHGTGSQELPPTSFSLEFLVEMHEMFEADGTIDKALRDRLFQSIQKAVVWAATYQPAIEQGYRYSNQYCGVMFAMWRLWSLTHDPKWKQLYDVRLDAWLKNAQPSLFWREGDGVDTFAYSHITEWELDRIFALNNDPRILEAFRKYFEWCSLNTVPENDGLTFITDIAGNGRTTNDGISLQVGYYNHIASRLPNSHPWAVKYAQTASGREKRVQDWLENSIPPASTRPGKVSAYHPFHNYPMYFLPHGMWTITPDQQRTAVQKLPTVSQERFTRFFSVPVGGDYYLFARRPKAYVTLHWGKAEGNRQVKELGLVWIPGFGTLLRNYNDNINFAYCTRVGDKSTYKQSILDFKVPDNFADASPNGTVTANDLEFATEFDNLGVKKTYRITNAGLEVITRPNASAIEQLPLYLDDTDTLTLDGKPLMFNTDVKATPTVFQGKTLRIKRICSGKTAYAVVEFDSPVRGTMQCAYSLAKGNIHVFSITIPANTNFHTRIKKGDPLSGTPRQ